MVPPVVRFFTKEEITRYALPGIVVYDPTPLRPEHGLVDILAPPRAKRILLTAALIWGITVADIVGPRRFKRLLPARVFVARRLRSELGLSYPHIARIMNRDHTTIQHYVKLKAFKEKKRERYESSKT